MIEASPSPPGLEPQASGFQTQEGLFQNQFYCKIVGRSLRGKGGGGRAPIEEK